MDIRDVFAQYCGPSVQFIRSVKSGRTLRIEYSIPAVGPEVRFIVGHLPDGTQLILWRVTRRAAAHARDDAYHRTGHYAADLKRLLSGRII